MRRRSFLLVSWLLLMAASLSAVGADPSPVSGRKLGTIFNNDSNNIIWHMGKTKEKMTPEVYRGYVERILDGRPGVLAQDVGFPEGVLYPTQVDTDRGKYWSEVCRLTWPKEDQFAYAAQIVVLKKLFEAGTDPLALTIEACRRRGVLVLADFRMNSEDLYGNSWMISDFGRAHPEYRIPGAGCLDPAVPAVYEHRMKIFAEVLSKYDLDGLELDFRRWYHMVSNPLENHAVLTRMVRDVRKMLDETARRRGRRRMLLGVRVGPMLEGAFNKKDFPGAQYGEPTNSSCKSLGLDVRTWVNERLVDYICPTLFSPMGLPRTKEFAELVRGTDVGVYPTISYMPCGATSLPIVGQPDNAETRRRYRTDICTEVLKCYADGADGVSLFNWFSHHFPPSAKDRLGAGDGREWSKTFGQEALGFGRVQQEIMPILSRPEALRKILHAPPEGM